VAPELDHAGVEEAIESGAIHGGMVPKVRAATAALASVQAVRICDLAGLENGGTRFIAGKDQDNG
jgi:acetylglutamate kinase